MGVFCFQNDPFFSKSLKRKNSAPSLKWNFYSIILTAQKFNYSRQGSVSIVKIFKNESTYLCWNW